MTASPAVPPPARKRTDAQIRHALLESLQQRILSEASGELIPAGQRLPDTPQRRIWLGQLSSELQLAADQRRGLAGDRLIPAAEGFACRVATGIPVDLILTVSFAVYVAVHPTLAEQRAFIDAEAGTDDGRAATPAPAPAPAPAGGNAPGRQLATVWQKLPVGPVQVHATLDPATTGAQRFGTPEITAAITSAVGRADLYRPRRRSAPVGSLPRDADMHDDAAWAGYVSANLLPATDIVPPTFAAAIDVDVTTTEAGRDLLITIVNTTPADDAQFTDRAAQVAFDRPHLDTHLYEVSLQAVTTTPLTPYTLEQVARSHRYDRTVEAFGQASPVHVETTAGTTTLRTTYGATAVTHRAHAGSWAADGQPIDTTFATFITDPVGAVTALVDAHAAWVEQHWSVAALDARGGQRGWDTAARAAADEEAQAARAETTWLRAGQTALQSDEPLREAFLLMNRAMQRVAAGKGFTGWWPFQIAWIVGCLPAVADPTIDEAVQIVTVPPGGGKSEAYNGVALVHLFHARLTGETAGVKVWSRFPLRLLSGQQTTRSAQAVLAAEALRRQDPRLVDGDPFGVGFFVGSTTTPNKLYPADQPWARGLDPHDPALAERCRVLEHCPVCDPASTGARVLVRFHEPSWTMQHLCTNARCELYGALPVWVIDDDIYRHAPSILVGTVDKLAQIAHSAQFKVIFGRALSRCPQHGYTVDPNRCGVHGCSQPRLPVGSTFGSLRCEVTDELHLLDESLGALDGMYETVTQQVGADLGNQPLHILAATATLEGYRSQVQHLYRRVDARRFPEPGPDPDDGFFSQVDNADPLRRYVGLRPRGTTMVTAAADITRMHAEWLLAGMSDPAAAAATADLDGTDPHVRDVVQRSLAHDYEVLLGYCLRNEDLASFTKDERVQDLLATEWNLATISGNVDASVIRAAVARLDQPPADPADRIRIIAATRAIGHGFDSSRLGVMVLMGTPTQATEVIQATARVGRTHPGLVVHVFNPSRDRDSSVFRYYDRWVRYLDRLVSKVPVNRESLPVLRRALPGALMARLLQVHDAGWMTSGPRRWSLGGSEQMRDALTAGYLDRAQLVAELCAGLGLDPANPYHDMHRAEVDTFVDATLTRVPVAAGRNRRTATLLSPPVPRSLRDIEEPIVISGNV